MTFGSLFAGIGGMDLGLERAGMTCRWQVEIDPYARRVLEKHWPDVRRWDDVRTFPPADGDWGVDLIAGGFPCQDISSVGKRAGITGDRSGLWFRFAEIVGLLRPRYVLVENVAELLVRGMDRVLGELSAIGYDAEWETLPAGAFGAPHIRSRVFVVAYPAENAGAIPVFSGRQKPEKLLVRQPRGGFGALVSGSHWASAQPGFCELDDGVPDWASGVGALGNAVVPQVAEFIGRLILEHHLSAD